MYYNKYLKYKSKYLDLKKGGTKKHSNQLIIVGDNDYNIKKIIDDLNKIKKPGNFIKNLKIIFNNKKYNFKKKTIKYIHNSLLYTNINNECKLDIIKLKKIGIDIDSNLIDNINKIIEDEFECNSIFEIRSQIILRKEYFKYKYSLENDQLIELYNIRYENDKYYKIPSILVTELTNEINIDQYKLSPEVIDILKNQSIENDKNYMLDKEISSKILINEHDDHYIKNEDFTFQFLFLLEYKLKTLIQDKMTEYMMNYMAFVDNKTNKWTLIHTNLFYSLFVLKIREDIEKNINNNLSIIYTDLENTLRNNYDQNTINFIKNILKNNDLKIKIVGKGGNVIKYLLSDNVEFKNNKFYLNDNSEYLKKLSDWDFDIKINYFDPYDTSFILLDNTSCDNYYMYIYQVIKNNIIKLINQYFLNIHENFNKLIEKTSDYDFNFIQKIIKCNLNFINLKLNDLNNQYLDSHHNTNKSLLRFNDNKLFNVIRKNSYDKFKDIGNCKNSKYYLDSHFCNTRTINFIEKINCKDYPNSLDTKDSILSYISTQYIGEKARYFDLTRLCIRLEVDQVLLKSKIECIDFGLKSYDETHQNLKTKPVIKLYKYNFNLPLKVDCSTNNFEICGLNIQYLIEELIVILITSKTKLSKRCIRLFKLIQKSFELNMNVFEIFFTENKLLFNLFLKFSFSKLNENKIYKFNLVDACIMVFIIQNSIIRNNLDKINRENIEIFSKFKDCYNNLVDNISSNSDEKLKINYNNYEFKSILSYNDYNDLKNYYCKLFTNEEIKDAEYCTIQNNIESQINFTIKKI